MADCENPQGRTQKPGKTSIGVEHDKSGVQISSVPITAVQGHYRKLRQSPLLCPAQLPGASDPLAAPDLIGINTIEYPESKPKMARLDKGKE